MKGVRYEYFFSLLGTMLGPMEEKYVSYETQTVTRRSHCYAVNLRGMACFFAE